MEPDLTVRTVVKEHVISVWKHYHKNISRACKALGIGRTTLYRWLRGWGQLV